MIHTGHAWDAGQVMEMVVALTRTNNSITVCATIHSPSPQTFGLFDKLIILLSGRIVYFGNNGALTLPMLLSMHVCWTFAHLEFGCLLTCNNPETSVCHWSALLMLKLALDKWIPM